MLTKKRFDALYREYERVVKKVCVRNGLRGADVDEVSQEVWTVLWRRREAWPDPEPTDPGAYLAECARRKAKMHFRHLGAQKRAGQHVPIEEDAGSAGSASLAAKLAAPAEALELAEQTSLGTLLRRLADKIGGEKRETMLRELEHTPTPAGDALEERPSAVRRGYKRMVAACRRQLKLPVHHPERARVDALSHLAAAVRGFAAKEGLTVGELELTDAE